jgi:hypothetical protein
MFAAVFAIGIVLAACLSVAVYSVSRTNAIDSARKGDRVRSDTEIAKVAKRVFNIEQPTAGELKRGVLSALAFCAKDRECAARFAKVTPGIRGKTGPRGQAGPSGLQGLRGQRGLRGPVGPRGRSRRGPRGEPGPVGASGPQGPAGSPGAAGAPAPVVP